MDVIHDTEQSTDPKTSSNAISFTSTEDLKKSQSLPTDKPIIRAEDLVFKIVKTEVDASAILIEALSVLNELEGELLGIEHSVKNWGEDVVFQKISKLLFFLQNLRKELQEPDETILKAEFQKKILPLTMQSEFCKYAFEKPRGYPGDFVMMEMIWKGRQDPSTHRYLGETELGKLINAFTLDSENCRANEHRIFLLKELLGSKPYSKIASIGCGSSIELDLLFDEGKGLDSEFWLFDQDQGALDFSKKKLSSKNPRLNFQSGNIVKTILGLKPNSFDFIYSTGLFDYFSFESAQKLSEKLWRALKPGGRLCITNAHPSNPTGLWMEYVGEWYLAYKQTREMINLVLSNDNASVILLEKDPWKVYQYFLITKET